jgi:hypothetical protein
VQVDCGADVGLADIVDVDEIPGDLAVDEGGKRPFEAACDEGGDQARGVLQWTVSGEESEVGARKGLLLAIEP